ncbi:hypothetical protein J3S90_04590 [Flavobacterium sp. P4023]|uniref:Uncharacterized protein n=1 Tax=Flavobacterium flabelliforme TaxID=2816119 RepID=A0ABS5CR32_9FLAO|nr:hypothetical protein [Flavobacterium flabelliforme]MBP4141074.1 hypothetical protein [Flavobacterium flabelliforme]
MKKVITFLFIILSSIAMAQNNTVAKQKFIKVKLNSCIEGEGYHLLLKEVLTDSRCPTGVDCIWAGQVSAIVAVYKDSKFIEEKTMVLTKTIDAENLKWINSYLNQSQRVINSLTISPYPNVKKVIKPEDYYLEIGYMQYN